MQKEIVPSLIVSKHQWQTGRGWTSPFMSKTVTKSGEGLYPLQSHQIWYKKRIISFLFVEFVSRKEKRKKKAHPLCLHSQPTFFWDRSSWVLDIIPQLFGSSGLEEFHKGVLAKCAWNIKLVIPSSITDRCLGSDSTIKKVLWFYSTFANTIQAQRLVCDGHA